MTAVSLRQIADEALGEVGFQVRIGRVSGKARQTVWDPAQPSFGLRTYENGRRIYVVQAWMQGRVRTVTLCNAALISRHDALDLARRILLRAQVDENPAEDRKRTRATPSYRQFLDLYWERVSPRWKPSTQETHGKYRRAYLDGAFGQRGIDKITQADVARWFASVARRGGQGAANRVLEILRAAFNKAIDWGYIPSGANPASGLKRYPQQRFARFLRPEELARIGEALNREYAERPQHVAALMLLLLTGCRRSEITGLLWTEVAGRKLKLSDSKTGPRTVWLGEEAKAILESLPQRESRQEVFWNDRMDRPLNLGPFWGGFCRRYGFEGLRIHDLRHSFASHGAALSETLPMIGKLLGHRNIQSSARYAHLDDRDLIDMAQSIGNRLERLMGA